MPVDPALLAEARAAEDKLIEAEHAADVARADFHRAVRRLQVAGGSMREVAAALGLSHQRVHQIVESAGGSRRWRKNPETATDCCGFCGRDQRSARKLICGPGVRICERCVDAANAALAAGEARGQFTPVGPESSRLRCSFCGKRRHQASGLVDADDVAICSDCLTLCAEIIAEELG